MKKLLALLLTVIMVFSLVACSEQRPAYGEVGEPLVVVFEDNADKSVSEIAELILADPSIEFMTASMPVEEGYLTGFDNAEITGFEEGVMFGPAIGTIPFVGYVFKLGDDADAKAFMQTLKDSANLRWNICTEADEVIVENEGDLVLFIMCPQSFEDSAADEGAVGDMAVGDEFAVE